MRKFLVSYFAFNLGGQQIFGNFDYSMSDGVTLTPELLRDASDQIKQRMGWTSIAIIAFSEYDKEES